MSSTMNMADDASAFIGTEHTYQHTPVYSSMGTNMCVHVIASLMQKITEHIQYTPMKEPAPNPTPAHKYDSIGIFPDFLGCGTPLRAAYVSLQSARQHTSAYVSIREALRESPELLKVAQYRCLEHSCQGLGFGWGKAGMHWVDLEGNEELLIKRCVVVCSAAFGRSIRNGKIKRIGAVG